MIPDFVVVSFVPLVSVVSKLPLAPLGANYPLYDTLAGSACELPFNYPFSGAVSIRPNTGLSRKFRWGLKKIMHK